MQTPSAIKQKLINRHYQAMQQIERKYSNFVSDLLNQKKKILWKIQTLFYQQLEEIHHYELSISSLSSSLSMGTETKDELSAYLNELNENIRELEGDKPLVSNTTDHDQQKEDINIAVSDQEQENTPQRRSKRLRDKALRASEHNTNVEKKVYTNIDKRNKLKKPRNDSSMKFRCSRCVYSAKYSSSLIKHMRIHTGEKPYKCSHCGKGFTQSSSLIAHIRIHTGERPYKCNYCGKGFTQSSAMKAHIKTHNGGKILKCKECGKIFKQMNALKKHNC